LLSTHLFEHARRAAHHLVVCEVNSDPPNPASDAFHAMMEFGEVGNTAIHQVIINKTVRYLAHTL
jgi:predicted GNAT superfamily acetyltransferase